MKFSPRNLVVLCSQSHDAYQLEIISTQTYNLLLVKTVSGHIVIIMWLQTVIFGMLGQAFQSIVAFCIIVKKKVQKEQQRNHHGTVAKTKSVPHFSESALITFCFVTFFEQYTEH